jgi:hypothetical protein
MGKLNSPCETKVRSSFDLAQDERTGQTGRATQKRNDFVPSYEVTRGKQTLMKKWSVFFLI